MQNGLDLGAILQKLLGSFTQSKSFNGQTQYINKQTGQSATCEDLKSFLQQEINAQQSPYGSFQEIALSLINFWLSICCLGPISSFSLIWLWTNQQINGNINTGTMNGGSQNIYVQQQQWNGYQSYGQMQQRNYNYYG